jgi:ribonucleotide reductase beta subunit family protein with ferritin-like domain
LDLLHGNPHREVLTIVFNASLNLLTVIYKIVEKIAKIQIKTAAAQIEQQTLALQTQLTTAYQTYLTNLELTETREKKMRLLPSKI